MLDLGLLGGTASGAWDLNELGQVVGGVSTPSEQWAFLWEDGKVTELGSLGGTHSLARSINDQGQIVGVSGHPQGGSASHACLWESGEITDLSALGGFNDSWAEAINNPGQVIGWGMVVHILKPFIYEDQKGMRDLRELLHPDSVWSGLLPRDLNDAEQIVGSGWYPGLLEPHAFLMIPIDADFNDDGHTDLADFASFQICLGSTDTHTDRDCQAQDINRNARVDLQDFQALYWVFTGP